MPDISTSISPGSSSPSQDAWVGRVLGVEIGKPALRTGKDTGSFVALQKSRLVWDATRKNVQAQLQALSQSIHSAVRAHNEDEEAEEEYDEADLASGVDKVLDLMTLFDEALIDKLDAALNASGAGRGDFHAEAAKIIGDYRAQLAGNELLGRVDASGFLQTNILQTVQTTLAALARQL